jgi:hypothetical protein
MEKSFKVAAMALLTAALTFTGTPIADAQCSGYSDGCPYGTHSYNGNCDGC